MKAEEGWRCEGDAAPGPYSTSTARMLLPGTLGNSRSKTFDTFVAVEFISCAATFVDSSEAPASSSKAIFVTVTLLLMRGFSAGSVPTPQLDNAILRPRCRGCDPNQPPIVRCSARRLLPRRCLTSAPSSSERN